MIGGLQSLPDLMDSTGAPLHSAASWSISSYGSAPRSPASDDTDRQSPRSLGATGHKALYSTHAGSRLASEVTACTPQGSRAARPMTSSPSRFRARHGDRHLPQISLQLTRAGSLQHLVFPLVALLVALVHHRRSYSVTLGSRTGAFRWPSQVRGCLRWRMTERD
jgi:hypothetical protein